MLWVPQLLQSFMYPDLIVGQLDFYMNLIERIFHNVQVTGAAYGKWLILKDIGLGDTLNCAFWDVFDHISLNNGPIFII